MKIFKSKAIGFVNSHIIAHSFRKEIERVEIFVLTKNNPLFIFYLLFNIIHPIFTELYPFSLRQYSVIIG